MFLSKLYKDIMVILDKGEYNIGRFQLHLTTCNGNHHKLYLDNKLSLVFDVFIHDCNGVKTKLNIIESWLITLKLNSNKTKLTKLEKIKASKRKVKGIECPKGEL